MRDHDQPAPEFFQPVLQPLHHFGIQMVRRLVEHQHVRRVDERCAQGRTAAFAARKRADALVDERFAVHVRKARQHLFPHGFCRAQERGALEDAAGEKVHHAHGVAAVKGRALRHIADAQLRLLAAGLVEGDLPFIFPLAQNGADERGLARAVRTDQRDHLAAVHMQVDVVQNRLAADMDGQMLDFQTAGVFTVACVRVQMWDHESASRMVSML